MGDMSELKLVVGGESFLKKLYYLAICLTIIFSGACSPKLNNTPTNSLQPYSGYIAIDPISLSTLPHDKNSNDQDPNLKYLHNIGSKTVQYQVTSDNKIEYLHSGADVKYGYYKLINDFVVSTPSEINLKINGTDCQVGLVIGVAIRIRADVMSKSGKVSTSDIPALVASSQNNEGGINAEIDIIGIKNSTILKLPRYYGEINSGTLGVLMQNIATINGELDNSKTEIIPQIIGIDIQNLPEKITLSQVIDAVRKWRIETKSTGGGSVEDLISTRQSADLAIISANQIKSAINSVPSAPNSQLVIKKADEALELAKGAQQKADEANLKNATNPGEAKKIKDQASAMASAAASAAEDAAKAAGEIINPANVVDASANANKAKEKAMESSSKDITVKDIANGNINKSVDITIPASKQ